MATKITEDIINKYKVVQFNNGKYALKCKNKAKYIDLIELKKGDFEAQTDNWSIRNYCVASSPEKIMKIVRKGLEIVRLKKEKKEKKKFDWSISKSVDIPLTITQELHALKKSNEEKDKTIENIMKELDNMSVNTNYESTMQNKKEILIFKRWFFRIINKLFADNWWYMEKN